jgi:predicted molibdopterin-dependent oxidoreductase YjgC
LTKQSHAREIPVKNVLSSQEQVVSLARHTFPNGGAVAEIWFYFDGKPLAARDGQSVAAALTAAGERCLRIDEAGRPKGVVCGIGVCWECRCRIDGAPDVRACMTRVEPGMRVNRQRGLD